MNMHFRELNKYTHPAGFCDADSCGLAKAGWLEVCDVVIGNVFPRRRSKNAIFLQLSQLEQRLISARRSSSPAVEFHRVTERPDICELSTIVQKTP
ncbi:hypothetical protein XENTR_v10013267 [Xenopus tropicalis]|nr:hypothetical protein XENTR_v10013267 [Xenopus tropicalis]